MLIGLHAHSQSQRNPFGVPDSQPRGGGGGGWPNIASNQWPSSAPNDRWNNGSSGSTFVDSQVQLPPQQPPQHSVGPANSLNASMVAPGPVPSMNDIYSNNYSVMPIPGISPSYQMHNRRY
ncbi:hypothetical protein BLA29_006785 [Euroglyphus maynei]|uniref:Uncharacterized protein n=1 Tax=Euroglyphus maynei TaxID=6958 RepID=A0A1Y3B9F9_EURMA|nr:hypothetical protein BLA29_006785 [Euroglyphus maynei]